MSTKEVIEWYESLPYEIRADLDYAFGNEGVDCREVKFYRWLKSLSKKERESYQRQEC